MRTLPIQADQLPEALGESGGLKVELVGKSDSWINASLPVPGVAPLAVRTTVAGYRLVITSLCLSLSSNGVPGGGIVTFVLREGATGVGDIVWAINASLPAVAGSCVIIPMPDMWLEFGSTADATLECTAAPPANVAASVCMTGTYVPE